MKTKTDSSNEMPELINIPDNNKLDFEGVEDGDEDKELDNEEVDEDALEALTSVEWEELLKNTDDVWKAIEKASLRVLKTFLTLFY